MPRRPRPEAPGLPLHVAQRGGGRNAVFLDEEDFATFRTCLDLSLREQGIALHAYVLLPDQVHLLLTSPASGRLASAMDRVATLFIPAFNRRHGRAGTPWDSRWTSSVVDSSRDVLAVQREIELNPGRAAIGFEAGDYRWSSVHASLGRNIDPLITSHPAYRALGRDRAERGAAWSRWIRDTFGEAKRASNRQQLIPCARESRLPSSACSAATDPFRKPPRPTTESPDRKRFTSLEACLQE